MLSSLRKKEVYDKMMSKQSRATRIKLKCLDCCCYQVAEVRKCPSKDCPLWIYRLGNVKKVLKNDIIQNETIKDE